MNVTYNSLESTSVEDNYQYFVGGGAIAYLIGKLTPFFVVSLLPLETLNNY